MTGLSMVQKLTEIKDIIDLFIFSEDVSYIYNNENMENVDELDFGERLLEILDNIGASDAKIFITHQTPDNKDKMGATTHAQSKSVSGLEFKELLHNYIDGLKKTEDDDVVKEQGNSVVPHIYHAGRIFSEATFNQRMFENVVLKLLFEDNGTASKFSPLFDNEANDKSDPENLPTAEQIFWGDTLEVLSASHILAELDDMDPGVVAELGIAWASNFIIGQLDAIVNSDLSSDHKVAQIKEEIISAIPIKSVYATISDIRKELAGEYDREFVPVGFNQFVIGMVDNMGSIYNNFEDAVSSMSNSINGYEVDVVKNSQVQVMEVKDVAEDESED